MHESTTRVRPTRSAGSRTDEAGDGRGAADRHMALGAVGMT